MKQSELFIMLAAAERDLASMSRARPETSSQQRADPRFVEAVAGARSALFMQLADYALQKEELEERLRAGGDIALSNLSAKSFRQVDYFEHWSAGVTPPTEKSKVPWPKCGHCGEDLILAHVDRGFCNAECAARARFSQ